MNFDEYQKLAHKTAFHPSLGIDLVEAGWVGGINYAYPAIGLSGETGEVTELIKKAIRDDQGKITPERRTKIIEELGDVLWYHAEICTSLGISMDEVAQLNVKKVNARYDEKVKLS